MTRIKDATFLYQLEKKNLPTWNIFLDIIGKEKAPLWSNSLKCVGLFITVLRVSIVNQAPYYLDMEILDVF